MSGGAPLECREIRWSCLPGHCQPLHERAGRKWIAAGTRSESTAIWRALWPPALIWRWLPAGAKTAAWAGCGRLSAAGKNWGTMDRRQSRR